MTDRSDGGRNAPGTDGGLVRHIPVMLNEVVQCLGLASGETIIDGTFGAGGYSSALLDAGANVVAIDQDPDAIAAGSGLVKASSGRLKLVQGRFSELDTIARNLGHESVNGVVLDIGVSSMQLDEAERGFSFQKDGPLDMRMAQSGTSASDVVNFADQATLTRIIGILGEERQASRISRAIVEQREGQEFSTTLQLAKLIEKTIGRKPGDKIHPATRSFQGLRIFVNRELEELANALFAAERILKPGGRLVVVTFHSLEDRIVKRFFADRAGKAGGSRHLPQAVLSEASFVQQHRGAISASREEADANPRSRSAKLRWAIRNEGEAHVPDLAMFGLPNLSHSQVKHRA
jgi:16S rRNA (cytosine1402-N4)-methyltransferase